MQGKLYHTNTSRRGAAFSAVGTLGLVVWAILAPRAAGSIVLVIGAALLLVLAWRAWVVGIRVGDEGVVIVQTFRTRRYPLSEVDRFEIRPRGEYPYMGHAILRNGEAIPTVGLQAPARPKSRLPRYKQEVQEQIDALNAALASRRGDAPPSIKAAAPIR